jgi:hypothetical protein
MDFSKEMKNRWKKTSMIFDGIENCVLIIENSEKATQQKV